MRTVFASTASQLLDFDPLAAVVLAEISADLFAKAAARHPDRVTNVGIREQLMIGAGGGVGASYDAARAGRTHQAPEDVALLDTVPGFTVHVPGPAVRTRRSRPAAFGDRLPGRLTFAARGIRLLIS